jgi:peptidoglycan/LPS O-acetylase OafA/YrhL
MKPSNGLEGGIVIESARPTPSRIPSLDGLRAISILFVMISHLWGNLGTHNHLIAPRAVEIMALSLGGLGVKIFFVISGFLITSLLLNELGHSGRIHLVKFYFRRTFRLLPPYYAVIATVWVGYVAGFLRLSNWHDAFIRALSYTTNLQQNLFLGILRIVGLCPSKSSSIFYGQSPC